MRRRNHTLKAILILTLFGMLPLLAQDIVINEFLASNVRDFPEMYDFGDYNDWIELYNSSTSIVNMATYFLSDDEQDPLKWKFPANTTLEANGFLLIWADGFNDGPGSPYVRETWPWDSYNTQHYHTNFKLSQGGEQLVLSRADIGESLVLVAIESFWKYLDDGSDQGSAWTDPAFIDNSWNSGPAELGYGDGDEATQVGFGPDGSNKYITTYFRKTFTQDFPESIQSLTIRLKRDDGAVVYLNGNEQFRSNMPAGDIFYNSPASSAVSSNDESAFFNFNVNPADLRSGENLIAVEIHQVSGSSSDVSFDLELIGENYQNTEIIEIRNYDEQLTDISSGKRISDNSWAFFGEPTPGYPNTTPSVTGIEKSTPVAPSLESGFYSGAQTVTLSTSSPSAQIHYTLDGNRPTSSSPLYSGSIPIAATSVLKTRSFDAGFLPGPTLTASYFIDEQSYLPTISLIAEPPTLWDSDIGIYENEYKQREIPVTIEYFTPNMEAGFKISAGARLGGMNIWTKPQKPFTIYTRNRFGDDLINYQLFPSKAITDFSRIVFRNGGDDWEETLIRDPMTESLVDGMMECQYMAYQPSALFLNGAYWGIHNIREKFDTRYFFENFGVDPTNIDHLEYAATPPGTRLQVIEGNLDNYNSMISFIQSNDINQPELYAELEQLMNIDGFIDHVAMTLYCANTSWSHNREWWRPRAEGGKWQWLIVDVDRGFNPANINNNLLDNLLQDYLLFQYLMNSQIFKDRFLQRTAAHINSTFRYERVSNIVDSLSAGIAAEMPRHIQRWGSSGSVSSMSYWEDQLDDIKSFAQSRPGILFNQFNSELGLSGTIEISVAAEPTGAGNFFIDNVPLKNPAESGLYFKNTPLVVQAIPAPGYHFMGWAGLPDSASLLYDCQMDTSFTALFQLTEEIILPQIINQNTVLVATQPYIVVENLRVEAGITLTISEGVEIRLHDDSNIIVEGQLLINGSLNNPVNITANTSAGASQWGGISFGSQTDTSRILYTNIRGASRGVNPIIHRGAISAKDSHLQLDFVDLQDVEFPIYIEGGSSSISNCTIRSEHICDFINVKRGVIRIDQCTFYGGDAPDTDAIDLDGVTDGIVSNNRIYNFAGYNSDGIDIGEATNGVLLTSNLIYHSSDKGISVGQDSYVIIDRNVIIGCVNGVAIKDNSSALLTNNTFYNNHNSVSCYEKNEGAGGGSAEVVNSILAGSIVSSVYADQFSSIAVSYSLSNTELIPGLGNLFLDPLFVNQSVYNLELSMNSPAIDAGDPNRPLDDDGSTSDIGAYYSYSANDYPFEIPGHFLEQLLINELLASNGVTNSDEAGQYDDWLEIYNPTNQMINLSGLYLTDSPDNLTKWSFPNDMTGLEPGGYLLVWCDEDINQGALHTPFKLNAGGEYLALVNTNGISIIDSIRFGPQATDIAFGRSPDGSTQWTTLVPTPGSSNGVAALQATSLLPQQLVLHQNYPNPFNPITTIRYDIPDITYVHLSIYDLRGRLVKTLVDGQQTAGYKSIQWNSTNDRGVTVATGIYLYTIQTDFGRRTKKIVLLK
ncbi:MAG: CotH kinase family protein [Candidatus Marinimicrobia bacterium]|nr:CotH kinase family protein [Candidatus Neomarinimicrobiota bacterium]